MFGFKFTNLSLQMPFRKIKLKFAKLFHFSKIEFSNKFFVLKFKDNQIWSQIDFIIKYTSGSLSTKIQTHSKHDTKVSLEL